MDLMSQPFLPPAQTARLPILITEGIQFGSLKRGAGESPIAALPQSSSPKGCFAIMCSVPTPARPAVLRGGFAPSVVRLLRVSVANCGHTALLGSGTILLRSW